MFDSEAEREWYDRYQPLATASDAHAEWHRNAEVPMGMPGCPQDACHPDDSIAYFTVDIVAEGGVRCGNTAEHARGARHATIADVRYCHHVTADAAAYTAQIGA